jgi:hypothetical protein
MSFLPRMQSQRANGTSLVFALSLPHVHGLLRAAGPNRTNFALAEPPKLKNFGADFGAAAPTSGLVFGVDGGRGRAAEARRLRLRRRQAKRTRALAAVEEKGALACRTLKDAAAAAAASPLARSEWREGTRAPLPISALAPALYPIISPLLHVNHVEWKLASERANAQRGTPRPDNIGQIMSKCFLNSTLFVCVYAAAADQMHTQNDLKSKRARQTRFGELFVGALGA